MGRSKIIPIPQPNEETCGPAALKIALSILGKRKSLAALVALCKTNRNGTSAKNMISAVNKLGFPIQVVEYADLRHLQSSLKYPANKPRAVLVSYLYEDDEKDQPHPDSGHWATVAAFSASKNTIVLFDSYTSQKKSYKWADFRARWWDYDLKRKNLERAEKQFKLVRRWQSQLLLIIARDTGHLPKFKISTAKTFLP